MNRTGNDGTGGEEHSDLTPEIAAEAAVWIARLHGPDRSTQMERECLDWQARSAAHRLAFEKCTEVWEAVPGVTLADAFASASRRGDTSIEGLGLTSRFGLHRRAVVSLCAALVAAVGLGIYLWPEEDTYATKVGEQQLVVLDDGTRMSLNTDTRVHTEMTKKVRSVVVETGEALFEVAKDPQRPFVVHAAGSDVVALGTVFSVRVPGAADAGGEALAVTLIEGRVSVRSSSESSGVDGGATAAQPVLMQAGERVRMARAKAGSSAPSLQVDRPRIEQMLAWKRNEALFDDVSLTDAVAEMNRYSRTPIVLLGNLSGPRVSGLYRVGDSLGFARAVAALHGLTLKESAGRLELAAPQ
ncbi:FecR family protein [Roseateles sp. NT4]|uniref:FecR family protein n=1 Tax=Roseateles sp. NT4 TaxID=3453715 RepID=UPI003EF02E14